MEEILKQILNEIKDLKADVSNLTTDLTGLKTDVSNLTTDLTGLKTDVSDLKTDVTNLKTDVLFLKEGQGRIETKVDSLSSELRSNFKYTIDKLDEHRKVFGVVSDELKGAKVDIEYLSSKTGRHDTELNQIMNKLRG